MSVQTEKIKELVELRAKARMGGGEKAIEKQHAKGKYTARERIDMLPFVLKSHPTCMPARTCWRSPCPTVRS